MIRNLLFSSSRRIVNVMSVKAQSQKPVRVATFNILAPCYYWIRWVSAAGENGYDTLWWMIKILFCHKAFCGLVFYCVIVASPPVLFIARKLLSSVRYSESYVIRQYANLSPIAYHIMQLTQNLLQLIKWMLGHMNVIFTCIQLILILYWGFQDFETLFFKFCFPCVDHVIVLIIFKFWRVVSIHSSW